MKVTLQFEQLAKRSSLSERQETMTAVTLAAQFDFGLAA